jgi:hypothetical protein
MKKKKHTFLVSCAVLIPQSWEIEVKAENEEQAYQEAKKIFGDKYSRNNGNLVDVEGDLSDVIWNVANDKKYTTAHGVCVYYKQN